MGNIDYNDTQGLGEHIFIKEVYGGCLCYRAGMPFRVAYNDERQEAEIMAKRYSYIMQHNKQDLAFIEQD